METVLSYSLEDFLLFSRETWSVLFDEYTQKVFLLPFITIALYLLTLIFDYIRPARFKPLNLVTQFVLLLSCCSYYWLFYTEINQFADILTGICTLLILSVIIKFAWLSRQRRYQMFSEQGRVGQFQKIIWLFLLPGICLLVLSEQHYSESNDWLLPGWYAGTSLLLLINLQLLNGERWWLFFSLLLIIIETLTLYLIEVKLWWLLILMAIVSLGALFVDIRINKSNQIQDNV